MTHDPRSRQPMPLRLRQWIYPVPRSCDTVEEWLRAHDLDIPEREDADLRSEGRRVQRRLDHEPSGVERAWLVGRLDAIRAELRRRGLR